MLVNAVNTHREPVFIGREPRQYRSRTLEITVEYPKKLVERPIRLVQKRWVLDLPFVGIDDNGKSLLLDDLDTNDDSD